MIADALQALRELYMNDNCRRHPSLPEYARSCRKYTDKTANGLTRCIIDWLNLNGHQAERINCTGRPQDNTRVVTDVLDRQYKIGSVKWLPTSGQKGTADISAIIRGRSVRIEVKIKDRQSEDQKNYQQAVERAGGLYWLVRSFAEFLELYREATNEKR